MERTIYIGNPAYLHCKQSQLVVLDPESREAKGRIPIEDIAYLVLDHPQITVTHTLLTELVSQSAVVLCCDSKHLPLGMLTPLAGHVEHTARIRLQVECSRALQKNLWKQTVIAKIANQARLLEEIGQDASTLRELQTRVLSGDRTNCEGVAARVYWGRLFESFRRDRHGESPNDLLNYGYAILLSLVARALVQKGFHLALGIQHSNKYNPYCLANDIMEPYRPYVDQLVYTLPAAELDRESKVALLTLPQIDTIIEGKNRPLQLAVEITAGSLHKVLSGELRQMKYPEL